MISTQRVSISQYRLVFFIFLAFVLLGQVMPLETSPRLRENIDSQKLSNKNVHTSFESAVEEFDRTFTNNEDEMKLGHVPEFTSTLDPLDEITTAPNLTDEQILESKLGPRRKPLVFVICMSTIYIIILVCGIMGNISTCVVIIYNNCMHTTTNYYLFSLALSDVLSLLTGK
jgi:hypothetical protein